MVIAVNALAADEEATDDPTSVNTASISPADDAAVFAFIQTHTWTTSTDPAIPTLVGGGMTTWTQIATVIGDTTAASRVRLTVFRALQATPGTAVATIGNLGSNADGRAWSIFECTGVDTSGTNGSGAVVQVVTDFSNANHNGADTFAGTVANFGDAVNNMTVAGWALKSVTATGAAGAGLTLIHEQSLTDNLDHLTITEYELGENKVPGITWSGSDTIAGGLASVLIEVKVAPAVGNTRRYTLTTLGVG